MNKLFNILIACGILSLTTFTVYSQEIDWLFNDGGNSSEMSQSIATDNSGNIYIAGSYYGGGIIGSTQLPQYGDQDIFVAKYDSNKNLVWVNHAGGPSQDLVFSIDLDNNGNVYITGFLNNNFAIGDTTITSIENDHIFLIKYSSNGEFNWIRTAGSYNQNWSKSVCVDNNQDIYIAGTMSGDVSFGDTTIYAGYSFFIAKYDTNGELLHIISTENNSTINAIEIDDNNNLLAIGDFSTTDLTIGDTVLIFNNSQSDFNDDVFIANFHETGTLNWARKFGGGSLENGSDIKTDNEGGIYMRILFRDSTNIDGNPFISHGTYDVILAKINEDRELIWMEQAGGQDLWNDKSIAINSGHLYYAGQIDGEEYFGGNSYIASEKIFLAKYNLDGDFQGLTLCEGNSLQEEAAIISNSTNLYLTGDFGGSLTLDSHTITSNGSNDIFIAKIELPLGTTNINRNKETSLYPNPAIDKLTIRTTKEIKKLKIYDILGHEVETVHTKHLPFSIDVSGLQPGIYIVKCVDYNGVSVHTMKFLKN